MSTINNRMYAWLKMLIELCNIDPETTDVTLEGENGEREKYTLSKDIEAYKESLKTKWLIWSTEHDAWWRPDNCGYTANVHEAGRYSYAEALKITAGANWGSGPVVDDNHRLRGRPYESMVREDAYGKEYYSDPQNQIKP